MYKAGIDDDYLVLVNEANININMAVKTPNGITKLHDYEWNVEMVDQTETGGIINFEDVQKETRFLGDVISNDGKNTKII